MHQRADLSGNHVTAIGLKCHTNLENYIGIVSISCLATYSLWSAMHELVVVIKLSSI